jgi:hypothetical protein
MFFHLYVMQLFCLYATNARLICNLRTGIERYPVKSTQILLGNFFRLASTQIVFRKKLCVILMSPYKNLGRFYRVPFESLRRVQIKWVNILENGLLRDLYIMTLGKPRIYSQPCTDCKFAQMS